MTILVPGAIGALLGAAAVGFVWWKWGAKAPAIVADVEAAAATAKADIGKIEGQAKKL